MSGGADADRPLQPEPPLPPELLGAWVVPGPPPGFADRVLARIGAAADAGSEGGAEVVAPALPPGLLALYRTPAPPPGFAGEVLRALAAERAGTSAPRPRAAWLRILPAAAPGRSPLLWKLTAAAAAAAMLFLAGQALLGPRPQAPLLASESSLRVTPRIARAIEAGERFEVPSPPGPLAVFLVAAPGSARPPAAGGR
jgi:hypothetical protein